MIKIDINLVFTIINLLVLYLLMKRFLFGPIINVMDQRKAMIDQQFAEAKERQDNAKALQEQYEGALRSAKEESYQIMEQAKKEAKAQADAFTGNVLYRSFAQSARSYLCKYPAKRKTLGILIPTVQGAQ